MNRAPESAAGFLDAVVASLLRWRVLVLVSIGVLAYLAWPVAEQIEFDQSIESLYAEDNPHFSEYARSKSLFGGDEFAIIAWREAGLFEPGSADISDRSRGRIEALAAQLAGSPPTHRGR